MPWLADRMDFTAPHDFILRACAAEFASHRRRISVDSFGNMLTPPAWLPHQMIISRRACSCFRIAGWLSKSLSAHHALKMRESTKAEGAATLEDVESFPLA